MGSCTFSHSAEDDPIVFPRFPGLSHDHSFVGNTTTNASSTLTSLVNGCLNALRHCQQGT